MKEIVNGRTYALITLLFGVLSLTSCDDEHVNARGTDFRWINISTKENFTDLWFIDDYNGIISGGYGFLARTHDGGKTWKYLEVGEEGGGLLRSFMLNPHTYFTVRKRLYISTNDGQSFSDIGGFSNNSPSIFGLHFFDENMGVILKGSSVYRTEDGGHEWTMTYSEANSCNILEFTSDSIGYVAGGRTHDNTSGGAMHKTTDGGKTWFKLFSGPYEITSVNFLNDKVGFYSSFGYELFKTQDGGIHWSKVANTEGLLMGMAFLDEQEGYAVAYSGQLFRTLNGGKTWSVVYKSPYTLTDIIKTPNHIYAIGNDGIILKNELK